MFSLEALNASHGDCLLLHIGTHDEPRIIMIDGGPHRIAPVVDIVLIPRLRAIAEALDVELPLDIELVVVSHVDDDHIGGLIDLLKHANTSADTVVNITGFWHNSFDNFLETHQLDAIASLSNSPVASLIGLESTLGVVADIKQGITLRRSAERLGIVINAGTGNEFVSAGDEIGFGVVKMKIVGPAKTELEKLQVLWDEKNPDAAGLSEQERLRAIAAFTDDSVANLSSIVIYVERDGRTMLLTGDARGDKIISGLKDASLLQNGRIELDVLKVPHHGSSRNVTTDFFRQVVAKHYIFSADGLHGNPDVETLDMVTEANQDRAYTMWFTNDIAHVRERLDQDRAANQRNYDVQIRQPNAASVVVNLGAHLDY